MLNLNLGAKGTSKIANFALQNQGMMVEFTARQVAALVGGKIEGNPEATVRTISGIEHGTEFSLSFLANPRYFPYLYTTLASVVLVPDEFVPETPVKCTLIRVPDPHKSFVELLGHYNSVYKHKTGIETYSHVSATAKLGTDVYVGAFSYIGENVVLGSNVKIYPNVYLGDHAVVLDDSVLFPGVKIYPACKIGARCTIHSGTVIGADGFGYAPDTESGLHKKVPQVGNVVIEDDVDIGAGTTIDRATVGSTIIRKGVKLDNLVHIAHNVDIGENSVICAQCGIAGSTKIGQDVMMGGQCGITGHITIANHVRIAAKSGIGASILNEGETVQGAPAFNIGEFKRSYVLFKKLPELEKRISELEQMIADLKQTT